MAFFRLVRSGSKGSNPVSRLADVNQFIAATRAIRCAEDLRSLMEPITREMRFDSYAVSQHVKHFSWAKERSLTISNFTRRSI